MMSFAVLLLFLVTMLMGVPIAMSMGIAAAVVIWFADMPLTVLAQRTVNSLDSVPLLAGPMPGVAEWRVEGLPLAVGGAVNRWTLRSDGGRTLVTLTSTVDPGMKPPGRIVAPLLARRLAKASDGMLAGLARHLQQGH